MTFVKPLLIKWWHVFLAYKTFFYGLLAVFFCKCWWCTSTTTQTLYLMGLELSFKWEHCWWRWKSEKRFSPFMRFLTSSQQSCFDIYIPLMAISFCSDWLRLWFVKKELCCCLWTQKQEHSGTHISDGRWRFAWLFWLKKKVTLCNRKVSWSFDWHHFMLPIKRWATQSIFKLPPENFFLLSSICRENRQQQLLFLKWSVMSQ